ncbi:MAG: tetratricopeptide repeat protein [Cyanobacteria bacterium P01_H01_bin.74]
MIIIKRLVQFSLFSLFLSVSLSNLEPAMAIPYATALQAEPTSTRVQTAPNAFHAQASLLLQKKQPRKAIPLLKQIVENDPNSLLGYFQLGCAYMDISNNLSNNRASKNTDIRQESLRDARKAFQAVLRLNDDLKVTYFKLGKISLLLNEPETAKAYYLEGLKHYPNNAALLFNTGRVYDQLHQVDAAIQYYEASVKANPGFTYALNNLALLYEGQENYTQAESAYKRALALNHSYHVARVNFANMLSTVGRFTEAEALFSAAIKQKPSDAWVHYYQGMMFLKTGDYQAASASYQRCIALKQDFAVAHYLLMLTYSKLNRMDDALQQSQQYLAQFPNGAHRDDVKRFILEAKLALNHEWNKK